MEFVLVEIVQESKEHLFKDLRLVLAPSQLVIDFREEITWNKSLNNATLILVRNAATRPFKLYFAVDLKHQIEQLRPSLVYLTHFVSILNRRLGRQKHQPEQTLIENQVQQEHEKPPLVKHLVDEALHGDQVLQDNQDVLFELDHLYLTLIHYTDHQVAEWLTLEEELAVVGEAG